MAFKYSDIKLNKQLDPTYLACLANEIARQCYTRNTIVELLPDNTIQIDFNSANSQLIIWDVIRHLSSDYYEQFMMLDNAVRLYDSYNTITGYNFISTPGYFLIWNRRNQKDSYKKGQEFGKLVSLIVNNKYLISNEPIIPPEVFVMGKLNYVACFVQGCIDFLKMRNEFHYLDNWKQFHWDNSITIPTGLTRSTKIFEYIVSYEIQEPNVF